MIVHHDSEHDCLTLQLGERFDFSIHRTVRGLRAGRRGSGAE